MAVEIIERAHDRIWRLRKLENRHRAARLKKPQHFAQAGVVVSQIAETERDCDEIERRAVERQLQGVCLKESGRSAAPLALLTSRSEHRVAEIGSENEPSGGALERKRQVARSATKIENPRVGALQDGP